MIHLLQNNTIKNKLLCCEPKLRIYRLMKIKKSKVHFNIKNISIKKYFYEKYFL